MHHALIVFLYFVSFEVQVDSAGGQIFMYLKKLLAKLCGSIPRYCSTSQLDTSSRCLTKGCAVEDESKVKRDLA